MAKTLINKEMAEDILSKDIYNHNRKVSQTRVKKFADEMSKNWWLYNGESITISKSGRVIDGQHRLLAIILSDVEIVSEFVTGIPDKENGEDVFLTVNTENRSNADALYIDGFHTKTPYIAKLMGFKDAFDNKKIMQRVVGTKLLNHEVVEQAREFGEKQALMVIERAETLRGRCDLLTMPYWILAVYVLDQVKDGNKFLEKLAECDDSKADEGDPVHALIKQLKYWKKMMLGGGAVSRAKWVGIFKSYDLYINDIKIKKLPLSKKAPIIYPKDYPNYIDA